MSKSKAIFGSRLQSDVTVSTSGWIWSRSFSPSQIVPTQGPENALP
uniref:Uncharacterized protein n=1 Tax=Anguilla anguilla TaxID=7936 RepID=A0A0E9Q6U9_ANGAN